MCFMSARWGILYTVSVWWARRCVRWAEDLQSLQVDIPWVPVVQASLQDLEILSVQEIQGVQESLSPPVKQTKTNKKNQGASDSYPSTHVSTAQASLHGALPWHQGVTVSPQFQGSHCLPMFVRRLQSDAHVL